MKRLILEKENKENPELYLEDLDVDIELDHRPIIAEYIGMYASSEGSIYILARTFTKRFNFICLNDGRFWADNYDTKEEAMRANTLYFDYYLLEDISELKELI